MLRFQRVIANGRPIFVPVNPSRNFLGDTQTVLGVPVDFHAGAYRKPPQRWLPPSRLYQKGLRTVDGWPDNGNGGVVGGNMGRWWDGVRWRFGPRPGEIDYNPPAPEPPIIVDHAPPPVGWHYDKDYKLVKDVPDDVVVHSDPPGPLPPITTGGLSGIFDTLIAWVQLHPFITAGGAAAAIWFLFLRGRGRMF